MADIYITFQCDNRTKEKLEKIADNEERSLSGQIRWVLERWLEE